MWVVKRYDESGTLTLQNPEHKSSNERQENDMLSFKHMLFTEEDQRKKIYILAIAKIQNLGCSFSSRDEHSSSHPNSKTRKWQS